MRTTYAAKFYCQTCLNATDAVLHTTIHYLVVLYCNHKVSSNATISVEMVAVISLFPPLPCLKLVAEDG